MLIDGVLSIACYLKGTDYGLSEEQLNVLSDFVLNGYGSIFRSVYKDYNAGGRLLSRKNALRKSDIVKNWSCYQSWMYRMNLITKSLHGK